MGGGFSEYPVSPKPSPFPVAPPRASAETPTPTLVPLLVVIHNPSGGLRFKEFLTPHLSKLNYCYLNLVT